MAELSFDWYPMVSNRNHRDWMFGKAREMTDENGVKGRIITDCRARVSRRRDGTWKWNVAGGFPHGIEPSRSLAMKTARSVLKEAGL